MANLFLTMMDRMGVPAEHFGDSTGSSSTGCGPDLIRLHFQPTRSLPSALSLIATWQQIDDALALSLMFGLDGKREVRVASMSISRPSLKAAAFSDAVARFYAGAAVQFMRMLPVGMEVKGPRPGAEPMLDGPLAKPDYKHTIHAMNDTADPAALIRNALTAHHDGNCLAILAGAATNFSKALLLPGVKDLIATKLRFLTVCPTRQIWPIPTSCCRTGLALSS